MAKLGIEELHLKCGSFNEKKNSSESFIMATSENKIFIWKMRDVLKNHLISNKAF